MSFLTSSDFPLFPLFLCLPYPLAVHPATPSFSFVLLSFSLSSVQRVFWRA